MIAGILGVTIFPLVGSVVAVITGPMAKNEIAESGGTLSGEGLAQAGTILGWVGIGLSVIGFCVVGVAFALPICLALFGIAAGEWSALIPVAFFLI